MLVVLGSLCLCYVYVVYVSIDECQWIVNIEACRLRVCRKSAVDAYVVVGLCGLSVAVIDADVRWWL